MLPEEHGLDSHLLLAGAAGPRVSRRCRNREKDIEVKGVNVAKAMKGFCKESTKIAQAKCCRGGVSSPAMKWIIILSRMSWLVVSHQCLRCPVHLSCDVSVVTS